MDKEVAVEINLRKREIKKEGKEKEKRIGK
jgi:hypothetical protein